MRKRKLREREADTGTIESMLNNYMQQMQNTLETFKSNMDSSIREVSDKINNVVTTTTEIKTDLNTLKSDYTEMKKSLAAMYSKQQETSVTLTDMQSSLEFSSNRIDTLQKRIEITENNMKNYNDVQTELIQVKQSLRSFQLDMNRQQQRERLRNIEIIGLPENKTENLFTTILEIAKYAGVDISSEDIEHVTRVQPRKSLQGRPRVIVAKLKQRIIKDSIIAGIRKLRSITTRDINITGEPKPLYINEHLTVANKFLLNKCKAVASDKGLKYVWVKNCQIFMRKSDASPKITIYTEEDLQKLH